MKIGLCIVTYNRPDYFKQCLEALEPNKRDLSYIVVVNDGTPYNVNIPEWVNKHIQLGTNKSVGVAKNHGMRELVQAGMEHIFIMEDDMLLKSPDIFVKYIDTATKTGIFHLNYALHGPANKKPGTEEPNPRQVVDYGDLKLMLYPHCVGAFTYFHRGVILNVGYHDERFKNAWEHVEYAYRVIKKGLHPPFWWFADIENSSDYITEIPESIKGSSIRHTDEWTTGMKRGAAWFKEKHGYIPVQIPDSSPDYVHDVLTTIEEYYGSKDYQRE